LWVVVEVFFPFGLTLLFVVVLCVLVGSEMLLLLGECLLILGCLKSVFESEMNGVK